MEEAFLDVRGAAAPAAEAAVGIRREVREQVGLPLSVGVARTKVLAKIASRSASPTASSSSRRTASSSSSHALPVERVWGVGPATARGCARAACGRSARPPRSARPSSHGGPGQGRGPLRARDRPQPRAPAGAPAAGPALVRRPAGAGRRPRSRADLDAALDGLAERVTTRACSARAARGAPSSCACGSATTRAPRARARSPTRRRPARSRAARELLDAAMPLVARRGITLVGLTVTNLDGPGGGGQLALDLSRRPRRGPRACAGRRARRGAPRAPPRTEAQARGRAHVVGGEGPSPVGTRPLGDDRQRAVQVGVLHLAGDALEVHALAGPDRDPRVEDDDGHLGPGGDVARVHSGRIRQPEEPPVAHMREPHGRCPRAARPRRRSPASGSGWRR